MVGYAALTVGSVVCLACALRRIVNPARALPQVQGKEKTLGIWRGTAGAGRLRLQVVYPAEQGGRAGAPLEADTDSCFFPGRARQGLSMALTGGRLFGYMLDLLFAGRRVAAIDAINLAPAHHGLPVVVFSHGLLGSAWYYTQLCREIASWGAVVVAVNHEDGTCTDDVGRVGYLRPPKTLQYGDRAQVQAFRQQCFAQRNDDMQTVFNFLTEARADPGAPPVFRAMNLDNIVLAGHSFGAASTVVHAASGAAHLARVKGLLLYDVWAYPVPTPYARLPFPTLSILSGQFAHNGEASVAAELLEGAASAPTSTSYYVPDTGHQLWSDFTFLTPRFLQRGGDPRERYTAWVAATHAFLDRHVSLRPAEAGVPHRLLKPFPLQ